MRAWRAYQLHDCCRIGIGWTTDAFRCLLFLFLYRKSPSLAGFTQSACRQKILAYKRQVYLHDDCDLIFVASLSFAMILDWSFAEYVRICEASAPTRDARRYHGRRIYYAPGHTLCCSAHPDRKKQQCKPVPKGKNGGATSNFLMNAAHSVLQGGGYIIIWLLYITSKQQSWPPWPLSPRHYFRAYNNL